MAIRAALTGHLVLSTIHTNSAWGIVSRLIDMGVEPALLADTLNTAVAQRLLKLLCAHCKRKTEFDPSLYPIRFVPYNKISFHYVAIGCAECFNTGYKGRKAVYEVVPIDEEFADSIKTADNAVQEQFKKKNIHTLSRSAFKLFEAGQTSLEEIYPLLMK
jgi:general secretion pathway protein E/type IV pilus assembly protein PilB